MSDEPTFADKASEIMLLVERMEAYLAEASEGDWFPVHAAFAPTWDGDSFVFNSIDGRKFYAVGVGDPEGEWSVTAFQGDGPKGKDNAQFIAAAKCAMPALLFAVRQMCELAVSLDRSKDNG